jgi:hypothetical protein
MPSAFTVGISSGTNTSRIGTVSRKQPMMRKTMFMPSRNSRGLLVREVIHAASASAAP